MNKAQKDCIIKDIQNEFLKEQLWDAAWRASTQRSRIYSAGVKERDKLIFRKDIKEKVFSILKDHRKSLLEDELLKYITDIASLYKNKNSINFRVGQSQKILNLMLKYYWCLGWLEYTPPHCPIDRVIIEAAKVKIKGKTPAWTKMLSIKEYKEIISFIKKDITFSCLSNWELCVYQKLEIKKNK